MRGAVGPFVGNAPSYVPLEPPRRADARGDGSGSDDDGGDEGSWEGGGGGVPLRRAPGMWPAPPVAPTDPEELLRVLQAMPQPRRRLVIFKSGGYIMRRVAGEGGDLEALITSSRLDHVLRVTNLMRKAHCALAKERWADGRRVDVRQHMQGAAKRGLPLLVLRGHRLEVGPVLGALRPLLIRKGLVRARRRERRGGGGCGEGGGEGEGGGSGDDSDAVIGAPQ
ncbi:MAG: hypothetical protein J3K34DRAFT_518285 [Monoraphidium minutum]|nr:MAG: hypothetical protein J3K34DRAFT_518285 [Monoraphidium minutum]